MRSATPRALISTQAAIESFTLDPAGETIVYALRTVVGEAYRSHLWLVPHAGGRARRLTSGAVRDTAPAFSPDGRRVAFVRATAGDPDAKPQVWLLTLGRARPRRLTRMPHGAGAPSWSPDGTTIAFLAEAGADRFAVGLDPRRPKRAPTARHITRLDYRDDTSGLLGRRSHLWTVAADLGARPTQLTSGDFDVTHPAWRPDGRAIAFAADRGPDANIAPRTTIHSVSVPGGRIAEIASLAGDADRPAWSPDGRWLAFIGIDQVDPPDHAQIGLWVQAGSSGPPRQLEAAPDRSVGVGAWADLMTTGDAPGPAWHSRSELLVIVADRGCDVPYRVRLDGGSAPLTGAERLVAGAVATAGGRVVLAAASNGRGTELHAVEADGTLRRLTRNGSSWQDRFPWPRLDERWVDGPGGPVQVWLASPADAAAKPAPTVVILHGGPTGAHAPGGKMDAIMLCAAGYRVAMPNPRGSESFGADWIAALGGRWGDVDAADVLAVRDDLVAAGLSDPGRIGVMGLSYGGYLTQWLVGATDRFRAAVSENGVANQISTWANSFFGVHYDRRAGLGDPLTPEGVDRLWATSPLRNVANVRTPLLMLQAEEDRNCPAADNEQFFTALKVLGREVEYVLYPEEHHGMKDEGRPDRRIDRMERILAWFGRWMPAG
jgi:dipeptidyl aminopeptidase/acylaminoacyl peptidase